jgi:hypothetical protein
MTVLELTYIIPIIVSFYKLSSVSSYLVKVFVDGVVKQKGQSRTLLTATTKKDSGGSSGVDDEQLIQVPPARRPKSRIPPDVARYLDIEAKESRHVDDDTFNVDSEDAIEPEDVDDNFSFRLSQEGIYFLLGIPNHLLKILLTELKGHQLPREFSIDVNEPVIGELLSDG